LALVLVRVLVRESKARLLGARSDDMLPLIMLVDRSDVDMPRTPRRDTRLMWWWLGSYTGSGSSISGLVSRDDMGRLLKI
jgi:hypothetical protein